MWEQRCLFFALCLTALKVAAFEYYIKRAKATWSGANEACNTRNGSILAVVDSAQKIDELSKHLTSLGYNNGHHKFWIGLLFNASIKEFVWSTGNIAKDTFINSTCGIRRDKNVFLNWCYVLKNFRNTPPCFEQRRCWRTENGYICQSGSLRVNSTAETSSSVAATSSTSTIVKLKPTTTSLTKPSSTISTKKSIENFPTTLLVSTTTAVSLWDAKPTISSCDKASSVITNQPMMMTSTSSSSSISSDNGLDQRPNSSVDRAPTTDPSLEPKAKTTPRLMVLRVANIHRNSISPSSSITSATGLKDRVQIKNPVLVFTNLVASLNPADPDSLQLLTDAYEDFANSIEYNTNKEIEDSTIESSSIIKEFAFKYASLNLNASQNHKRIENQQIVLQVSRVLKGHKQNFTFSKGDEEEDVARITLPSYLFFNVDTLVVNVLYQSTHRYLGSNSSRDNKIDSRILGSSIRPSQQDVFTENVTIVLRTYQENDRRSIKSCAFWKWDYAQTANGSWSGDGCSLVESNRSHVVCTCNHLTNFAILMNIKKFQVPDQHRKPLAFITYIGLGVSLLGETITILAYMLLLCSRHDQQSHIHVSLVATLATAQMIFLAGIEATHDQVLCITVAALIHYFYLSSFCWMLMEGLMLYLLIIEVYNTDLKLLYCYCFSYGFPGLIVGSTLLIAHLTDDGIYRYKASTWCWLSTENHYIWSFVAPIILITAVNATVFFGVVREMVSMPSAQSTKLNALKTSVKACIVLFPLLGVTWLFGLLSIAQAGVVPQYIFTVLNSIQGFSIFILHCVRNSEIRSAWNKKLNNLKKQAWRFFTPRSPPQSSTSEAQSCRPERSEKELGRKSNKIAPVEG